MAGVEGSPEEQKTLEPSKSFLKSRLGMLMILGTVYYIYKKVKN